MNLFHHYTWYAWPCTHIILNTGISVFFMRLYPKNIQKLQFLGYGESLSKSHTKYLLSFFAMFWFLISYFLITIERLMNQKSRPWKDSWCNRLRLVLPRKRRSFFVKWRWIEFKDQKRFALYCHIYYPVVSKTNIALVLNRHGESF